MMCNGSPLWNNICKVNLTQTIVLHGLKHKQQRCKQRQSKTNSNFSTVRSRSTKKRCCKKKSIEGTTWRADENTGKNVATVT